MDQQQIRKLDKLFDKTTSNLNDIMTDGCITPHILRFKLNIDYASAVRIMDRLEAEGYVTKTSFSGIKKVVRPVVF